MEDSPFGTGTGNTIISNLTCRGTESDLGLCESTSWNQTDCPNGNVATLDCMIPCKLPYFFSSKNRYWHEK